MSVETLLTLAVAGVILVMLGVLRITVALAIRSIRAVTGRPAPEVPRLAETRRTWAERRRTITAGSGSIVVVIAATIVTWLHAIERAFSRERRSRADDIQLV